MNDPRVAVLTLTRDRLRYTQAAFASLRENAGLAYDHYVLDQGSTDGTQAWLEQWESGRSLDHWRWVGYRKENIGIHAGMNAMLTWTAKSSKPYDLLVKVDNDCELLNPGTLKAVAEHVLEDPEQPRIVSPLILGLRNRPGIYMTKETRQGRIGLTRALGGVFMPIPPLFVKEGFRYDESAPVWGGDDERLSAMAHERGGYTAYLIGFEANHIETTDGQHERYPDYFRRRVSEQGPP